MNMDDMFSLAEKDIERNSQAAEQEHGDAAWQALDADIAQRLSNITQENEEDRIALYRETLDSLRAALDEDSER